MRGRLGLSFLPSAVKPLLLLSSILDVALAGGLMFLMAHAILMIMNVGVSAVFFLMLPCLPLRICRAVSLSA